VVVKQRASGSGEAVAAAVRLDGRTDVLLSDRSSLLLIPSSLGLGVTYMRVWLPGVWDLMHVRHNPMDRGGTAAGDESARAGVFFYGAPVRVRR
jgi:hypothetical protein